MQTRSLLATMQARTLLALTAALLGSAALTPVTAVAAGLPTCAQLATDPANGLAGNANITQTASDNQGLVSPSAVIVPATATNAAYCKVHLQYSSQSGPAHGYAVGESQTIGINIGLPLNSTDGGTPHNPSGYSWTAVNGAWNGKVENLGGGGLAGSLGSVTQPTNAGYVGSITDGGHSNAQNGTDGTFACLASDASIRCRQSRRFCVGKPPAAVSVGLSVGEELLWSGGKPELLAWMLDRRPPRVGNRPEMGRGFRWVRDWRACGCLGSL